MLAEAIAGEPNAAQQRAEDAGRRWAKSQVPLGNLTWDEGTREVVTVFDRLGFAPRLVDDELGRRVELAACPFRDLARQYPEVICVVHAGLLRGLLSRLGIPHSDRADMRPFVREDLCIAEFPGSDGSVLGTG